MSPQRVLGPRMVSQMVVHPRFHDHRRQVPQKHAFPGVLHRQASRKVMLMRSLNIHTQVLSSIHLTVVVTMELRSLHLRLQFLVFPQPLVKFDMTTHLLSQTLKTTRLL